MLTQRVEAEVVLVQTGLKRNVTHQHVSAYDGSVIRMVTKTIRGPNYLLDKQTTVEIDVARLVEMLPGSVSDRMREALVERAMSKQE